MSALVTLYFQLHQPYRLRHFRFCDIGRSRDFFDINANREIFLKVAERCYWPAGFLLEKLLHRIDSRFSVAFSISGTWLDQCAEWAPGLLELYQRIARLPNVELLGETCAHSLVAFFDPEEFALQVAEHSERIAAFCGVRPAIFRNTELAYSNEVGRMVAAAGFVGCMVEGWEHLLESDFNASRIFRHPFCESLKLLPRNYRRSDDIAFRFSNRSWKEWPLDPQKYVGWLEREVHRGSDFLGLYMDYETLGEHQSAETGIFEFLEQTIEAVASSAVLRFVTPSQAIKRNSQFRPLDVPVPLSWADTERDLSAWLGNSWQREACEAALALRDGVYELEDSEMLRSWRRLLTSDHFYYMSTKCSADGDVHGYFSPYASPHDAYLEYRNVLSAFEHSILAGRRE